MRNLKLMNANSQQASNEKSEGSMLVEGISKILDMARERFLRYQQRHTYGSEIPPGKNWRDVQLQKFGY